MQIVAGGGGGGGGGGVEGWRGRNAWLNQPWRACHVDIVGVCVGETTWNGTL